VKHKSASIETTDFHEQSESGSMATVMIEFLRYLIF